MPRHVVAQQGFSRGELELLHIDLNPAGGVQHDLLVADHHPSGLRWTVTGDRAMSQVQRLVEVSGCSPKRVSTELCR